MPHKRTEKGQLKQRKRIVSFEHKIRERDTARAIVKDLCQRDPVSGEISFQQKKKAQITNVLLAVKYVVETECPNLSPNVKRKHIDRYVSDWFEIDVSTVDAVLQREDGEVLNRAILPCWWRSPVSGDVQG